MQTHVRPSVGLAYLPTPDAFFGSSLAGRLHFFVEVFRLACTQVVIHLRPMIVSCQAPLSVRRCDGFHGQPEKTAKNQMALAPRFGVVLSVGDDYHH
jgi:hypothetical protein